jgi:hypothetical protein
VRERSDRAAPGERAPARRTEMGSGGAAPTSAQFSRSERVEPDSSARRAAEIALGAVVLVGAAIAVYPQHAVSLLGVLAASVAVVVGGAMVAGSRDEREGRGSVFERIRSRAEPRVDPPGLATIREMFDRPIPPGEIVPGRTRLRLARIASPILARHNIDITRPEQRDAAGELLSATTVSAIAPPAQRRPDAPNHSADPERTAAIVEHALTDLDLLGGPTQGQPSAKRRTGAR